MRLVALLSARTPAAGPSATAFAPDDLRIGVHLPVEHQARQAILAGAEQLVIRSELPTPELARMADQLSRETGIPVLLANDGPELTRRIEKDDRVLLLAAQMIVPQSAMDDLAAASVPALLVTPTEPATAHLERVDARHVWAGGALLAGETLLGTVDMLGEWDLELTLLRRAVQQDARRIELPVDMSSSGRLARIDDRAEAEKALAALSQEGFADEGGRDALTAALAPVARGLVATLTRLQVNPDHMGWTAAMLAIFGVAAGSAGWPLIALPLALLAEATLGLHRGSAQLLLRRGPQSWLQVLVKGASLAVLATIGGRLADGDALALLGVGLPLALIAVQTLADARDRRPAEARPNLWQRFTTPMALILALLGALGGHPQGALVAIGLCAFGTVAARLLAAGDDRI